MATRETINRIIREIAIRYGANLPCLNNNNICTMLYKDKFKFIIEVSETGTSIYFYSPLVEKVDENNEWLQQKLLQHNFLFGSMAGASLALDEQTSDVVMCQVYAENDLNTEKLEQNIESFLSEAEKIQETLLHWMHHSEAQNPNSSSADLDKVKLYPTQCWMA